MNDSHIKELKKSLLDIEKLQKLAEEEKKWVGTSLEGSGPYSRAIGLIEAEYYFKKQLIDENADNIPAPVSTVSPEQRDHWYEDRQLKFKLASGKIDQLDFSKAEKSRKIFEAFWYLWVSDGIGEYTSKQVRDKYRELHKKDVEEIGTTVSNIRPSIINSKGAIRDRISWEFDKKKQKWIFKIYQLKKESY